MPDARTCEKSKHKTFKRCDMRKRFACNDPQQPQPTVSTIQNR